MGPEMIPDQYQFSHPNVGFEYWRYSVEIASVVSLPAPGSELLAVAEMYHSGTPGHGLCGQLSKGAYFLPTASPQP
jgi:hypothetical protein